MSTTVTFSHESQCGHKQGFASKRLAKQVARRTETIFGGGRVQAYFCTSYCQSWHVGHRPHPDAVRAARHLPEA
jgi:hypothetical protein